MKKILVTGASGYLGSWIIKLLLDKGHHVIGTVRDKSNTEKTKHLLDLSRHSEGKLTLENADLLNPEAFNDIMEDCEEVFHVASPFIFGKITDPVKQLVNPAVQGTENVLNAVNRTPSVKRVILTSSFVAVAGDGIEHKELGIALFDESHWNQTSTLKHMPYNYSKVLAEKKAWEIYEAQDRWKLSVINPSFILGPALSLSSSSSGSFAVIEDFLNGKYAMGVPNIALPAADIRDVAKAHVLASEKNSDGRHIIAEKSITLGEIGMSVSKGSNKKVKISQKLAPKIILLLFGWMFGVTPKYILRNYNYHLKANNSRSIEALGLQYRPVEKGIQEMAGQMTSA